MQCASIIKEIGRGKDGARNMGLDQARAVWAAILAGEVSDLELGALLLAMRIKGESVDELAGFLQATHARLSLLPTPSATAAPVVIPSYNGARHLPNLVPLLAILLAERGVPVLVHGIVSDPMLDQRSRGSRVTTGEVFHAMGLEFVRHADDVSAAIERGLARQLPVFVPIQVLHPSLAHVLSLRRALGVRNSAHTLVKLLQPFECTAVRLGSFTHPEYEMLLDAFFRTFGGDALVSRGTEGEVVANPRRQQRVERYHGGVGQVVVEAQDIAPGTGSVLPLSREAATTAVWTQSVLAGEHPVPPTVAQQVEAIVQALAQAARPPEARVA